MTARFIDTVQTIWMGVRESVFSWLVLIAFLAALLLVFGCFTSPVKLAKKKLKKLSDTVRSILPRRKNRVALEVKVSSKDLKKIQKDAEYTHKMLLAYWYDHSDDIRIKNAMQAVKKISGAIKASRQGNLSGDPKAMGYLIKNIETQAESGLEILREY